MRMTCIAYFILCFVLGWGLNVAAEPLTVDMIETYLRSFEYDKVIELSEQALADEQTLSDQEIVHVYQMKAIAHYSKRELDDALSSFIQLLKIDSSFELDPVQTSPKIIDFFQQIKQSYHTPETVIQKDTLYLKPDTVQIHSVSTRLDTKQIFSVLLPGTGQMLQGRTLKGSLFAASSTALLGLAVTSWIECRTKERAYLKSTEPHVIREKYQTFNKAYQKRNTYLALYAGIWALSQIDLYVFQKNRVDIHLSALDDGVSAVCCQIHF